jgi:hypothetical protein
VIFLSGTASGVVQHTGALMQLDLASVRAAAAAFPKPEAFKPSYGTAGFRAEASLLSSTVFRCGMLIGIKAKTSGKVSKQQLLPACVVHQPIAVQK